MINGNYVEFLDNLNYGEEMYLKYKGKVYFVQGWHETETPSIYYMCCTILKGGSGDSKDDLWESYKPSLHECAQEFLEQPIFEGKKLPEIEREVEWVDDELGQLALLYGFNFGGGQFIEFID